MISPLMAGAPGACNELIMPVGRSVGRCCSDFIESWLEIGQPARAVTKAFMGSDDVDEQCKFCEKVRHRPRLWIVVITLTNSACLLSVLIND